MEGLGLLLRTGAGDEFQELLEAGAAGALQEAEVGGAAEPPVWRAGVEDLR